MSWFENMSLILFDVKYIEIHKNINDIAVDLWSLFILLSQVLTAICSASSHQGFARAEAPQRASQAARCTSQNSGSPKTGYCTSSWREVQFAFQSSCHLPKFMLLRVNTHKVLEVFPFEMTNDSHYSWAVGALIQTLGSNWAQAPPGISEHATHEFPKRNPGIGNGQCWTRLHPT